LRLALVWFVMRAHMLCGCSSPPCRLTRLRPIKPNPTLSPLPPRTRIRQPLRADDWPTGRSRSPSGTTFKGGQASVRGGGRVEFVSYRRGSSTRRRVGGQPERSTTTVSIVASPRRGSTPTTGLPRPEVATGARRPGGRGPRRLDQNQPGHRAATDRRGRRRSPSGRVTGASPRREHTCDGTAENGWISRTASGCR